MTKFSIVVPVYNVEAYIDNCLKSIESQTFQDFEVIIVNDGSPDNSQKIIDEYVKKDKRFKSYTKENGGLSSARNFGVEKAKGDYLVFVDSDDSINKDLLELINNVAHDNVDIVRFQINQIFEIDSKVETSATFVNLSGEEAFIRLINNSWFVTACASAIRREYWLKNKYSFPLGRIHEDFGLIPYVYINAKKVSAIDYAGYNYYVRDNSLMTNNSVKRIIKKNEDCLYHFDRLMEMINGNTTASERGKKYFKSFISYTLINRSKLNTDKKMLKDYVSELNKRNIGKYLIDDTLGRKIKKYLYNVSPMLYIKLFVK